MPIELARDVLRLCDRDKVWTDQAAIVSSIFTFADPHFAPQHKRHSARLSGMLNAVCHPSKDVGVKRLIPLADVFADVCKIQSALFLTVGIIRRDGKALPQIVGVRNFLTRRENDMFTLPTLRM